MKGKLLVSLFTVCAIALTSFAASGYSYNLIGGDSVLAVFGLKEKREGTHMVKRRTVSVGSVQQVIDKQTQTEAAGLDLAQYPKVRVVATGYSAGIESTGKTPSHPSYGITYSGVKVRRDAYSTIAADLRVFPLGTILYIPGYGFGVVADKGGAIRGNKIDLYFRTVNDVYSQWGKRTVDVYVVRRGDGKVTETMMRDLNEKGIAAVFKSVF